jgi:hypothetical protein
MLSYQGDGGADNLVVERDYRKMQDKYVGDVGDFGKYGMLRSLFSCSPLKLGVNWCLVERDEGNNDGKHISFLNLSGKKPDLEKQFKPCDVDLYWLLQSLVRGNHRSVEAVEKSQFLGRETIFFHEKLDVSNRILWHLKGLKVFEKADIVFFDPDNGMELDTCPKTRKNHVKYVYYEELAYYYNRGQSLIIYQHKDRKPTIDYLEKFYLAKKVLTKPIGKMFLLRFHRFAIRDYFFVLHPEHVEEITNRVSSMLASMWGSMFDRIDLEEARI